MRLHTDDSSIGMCDSVESLERGFISIILSEGCEGRESFWKSLSERCDLCFVELSELFDDSCYVTL